MNIRAKWDSLGQDGKKRLIRILVIILFVVPIVGLIIYRGIFSATVTLTFAPKSADTVKIGNFNAKFGDNYIPPGTYEVEIAKKGFETYKETITLGFGETKTVEAALDSNDPATADWYQNNLEDYSIAQGIGDRRADKAYAEMMEKFPIAKDLPINGLYSTYTVSYGTAPDSNDYAVYISYQSEEYKQQAIDAIQAKGYNLNDYKVIYQLIEPTAEAGVTVYGLLTFSEIGLSRSSVDTIRTALTDYYSPKLASGQSLRVEIVNVTQTMNENNTVYNGTLNLSNGTSQALSVETTLTTMLIKVNGTVIYNYDLETPAFN